MITLKMYDIDKMLFFLFLLSSMVAKAMAAMEAILAKRDEPESVRRE